MRTFYCQTIEFNETITAGGSSTKNGQVDTGGLFVCESLIVSVWLPDAQSSAIAGTPAADSASATAASNTFITLTQLMLQLQIAGVNWFSSPVRCSVFGAGRGNPFYFQTKPVIPPLGQLVGTLTHTGAQFNVRAQVALVGYRTNDQNDV